MTRTNTEDARFAKASLGVTATTIAAILLGNASVARAETFDGPYVGVAGGYEDYSDDLSGATYKAYAGWNIRLGDNWVLAPEVSFGESTADSTEVRDTATFTETAEVGIDRQIGANLRFGRLVSDNVLVYAAGGWERFEVDARPRGAPSPATTAPRRCRISASTRTFGPSVPVSRWRFPSGSRCAAPIHMPMAMPITGMV